MSNGYRDPFSSWHPKTTLKGQFSFSGLFKLLSRPLPDASGTVHVGVALSLVGAVLMAMRMEWPEILEPFVKLGFIQLVALGLAVTGLAYCAKALGRPRA
jgi:hypothetical protein